MILTISDSEEGILNKIKSVLACESTLEVMEITNSEKLTFQGLEIDQLQRSVIKDGKVVELTRHEYDLLFYLAYPQSYLQKNRFTSIFMRMWSQKWITVSMG